MNKNTLKKHTPDVLKPVTKAQISSWLTPPGDYCFGCDTRGSRRAVQNGNLETRTCQRCHTPQTYVTK